MTAQETDSVFYEGRKYDLIGSSRGELLFDIFKFGLKPEMISTACYRGFYCDYTLNTKGLFVRKLTVYDKSGNYPVIRSVKPEIVEDYLAVYNKPDIKIRLSGRFRIARGFMDEYYIHMGYQKPSTYRTVIDFTLSKGKLVSITDRSEEAEKIRGLYKEYYGKMHLLDKIDSAFSLDMDFE